MTADKEDKDGAQFSLLESLTHCAEIVQCQSRKKVFSGESEEAASLFLVRMRCFVVAHAQEDKEDEAEVEGVGHQGRIANARVS